MIITSLVDSFYSQHAGQYIPGRKMRAIRSRNWDRFVEQVIFLLRQEYPDKSRMPLISPAIYGNQWWRKNENVVGWDVVMGDVDEGCSAKDMALMMKERGMKYLIYSSPSYIFAKQKCRIILPLSRRAAQDELRALWHAFHQFCESIPDPACKDPSRAYYIGRKPDCERFFACGLDGSDFDVDAMIERYPVPPPKEYKPTYTTFAPNTLRWANIEDCPYLHPKWFAEYQGRSLGHYPLLYTVMCSVVGYARKKGVELDHHELVDIAIAFDHACGGPVQSRHGHRRTAQRMQDVLDFVR